MALEAYPPSRDRDIRRTLRLWIWASALVWVALIWGFADPPHREVIAEYGTTRAAIAACSDYNLRARGIDPDPFEATMASSCNAVLAYFASETPHQGAAARHGAAYIQALAELHEAGLALRAERREEGFFRQWPTLTGEFLMARHLGVMAHYESWKSARPRG